jgi:hypothetical protein
MGDGHLKGRRGKGDITGRENMEGQGGVDRERGRFFSFNLLPAGFREAHWT